MFKNPRPWGDAPFQLSPRTPGPLGHNDAADPYAPDALLGDTPGSLGVNDLAASLASAKPPKAASKPKKMYLVTAAFERCQQLGWIPFFQEAAQANSFEPELLMGIGYRESGLNPKYLKVAGDNGHGYGLMQADIRAYPEWVKAENWKNAKACISKGAEVLASKREEIKSFVGEKNIKVKTLAGQTYSFDGKQIGGQDLLRVTVAAYNCGMWAYYHYSKGHDVDRGTTGQDYSKDVLEKTARFKQLLDAQDSPREPDWIHMQPPPFSYFA